MQTFVPYGTDFKANAAVLDRQRLGKQRVEAWQILNALQGRSKGWVNHPATRMWRGYEAALCDYAIAMCDEWLVRGYTDTMRQRFVDLLTDDPVKPGWLLRSDVKESHRSNLIRKMPDHYGPLWPAVADDLPYVWPVTTATDSLVAAP
jgi:hypothetical protein